MDVRRRLAMAVRVRDYMRALPSLDPVMVEFTARLEDRIKRGDVLVMEQHDGTTDEHAATDKRRELRAVIYRKLVHVVRVANFAARSRSELVGEFKAPRPHGPYKMFITAAVSLLAKAQADKDLFGADPDFLQRLAQAIAAFDAATETAHRGTRAHTGASAELDTVASDCVRVMRMLDGLVRERFAEVSEELGAWENASNIVGSAPKATEAGGTSPAPGTGSAGTGTDAPRVAS